MLCLGRGWSRGKISGDDSSRGALGLTGVFDWLGVSIFSENITNIILSFWIIPDAEIGWIRYDVYYVGSVTRTVFQAQTGIRELCFCMTTTGIRLVLCRMTKVYIYLRMFIKVKLLLVLASFKTFLKILHAKDRRSQKWRYFYKVSFATSTKEQPCREYS